MIGVKADEEMESIQRQQGGARKATVVLAFFYPQPIALFHLSQNKVI